MNAKQIMTMASLSLAVLCACQQEDYSDYSWVKTGIDRAKHQLMLTATELDGTGKLPRSIHVGYNFEKLQQQLEKEIFVDSLRAQPSEDIVGTRRTCDIYDWTSGFFPGSLWYVYEFTGDKAVKEAAIKYTELLNPIREYTGTHDLGYARASEFYPRGMPANHSELNDWWDDLMDADATRLVLFTPPENGWSYIAQTWDNTVHIPSVAGGGLAERGYGEILNAIANSV